MRSSYLSAPTLCPAGLDFAQSLASGALGRFTNKYTVVVEGHLARKSVVVGSAGQSGVGGNGKDADPFSAYEEQELGYAEEGDHCS